jgi:hypothetical protein
MKYLYVRIAALNVADVIADIRSQLKEYYEPGDEIVFHALVENIVSSDILPYCYSIFDTLSAYTQQINIPHHFLLHDTARELTKDRTDVYYLNTWGYITYKHSITNHRNKWNPNIKKALFLIGKPLKRQRIGLMHHFYVNKLLDYLDYSLYFPANQDNINAIKAINLNYLQDHQYINKFLIDVQRPSLDIDISKCYDTNVFEYTGFPTNLSYYKNTCLSIVSENSLVMESIKMYMPYLTEKLYRAMMNHHPFIIIGDYGINDHLRSLGYKTFDKFFLPYTNSISHEAELILDWTAKSVKHFIDNLDDNVDEIREMITHNYNHYINQTENELKHLLQVLPYLDLEDKALLGKL